MINDWYSFIVGITHADLSTAVKKADVLGDNILAYRKGKSAVDAMLCTVLLREECHYTGEMVAEHMDDEEKFFDRVEGV